MNRWVMNRGTLYVVVFKGWNITATVWRLVLTGVFGGGEVQQPFFFVMKMSLG